MARVYLPSIHGLDIIYAGQLDARLAERSVINPHSVPAEIKHQTERQAESFAEIERGWRMYEPLPHTKDEAALWKQYVPA